MKEQSNSAWDQLWKNIKMMGKAHILAQALLVLASPILSRLFSPEDFGLLALYTAIVTIIVSVSTFRFDWLIPNSKDYSEALHLIACGVASVLFTTLILCIILLVSTKENVIGATLQGLYPYRYLILIGVLVLSFRQVFTGWFTYTGNLKPIAISGLSQSFSNVLLSISLGLLVFSGPGLIVSAIAAGVVALAILCNNAKDLLEKAPKIKFFETLRAVKKWRSQAALSTLVSVLNTLSTNLFVVILGVFYSASAVGLFGLADRIVSKPVSVISSALSSSFWSHAASLFRSGDYVQLHKNFLRVSLILGFASILVSLGCVVGYFFVVPIFGEEWSDMGAVLLALIPMLVGKIVVSPTNHLVVMSLQKYQLYADSLRLFLICFSLLISSIYELPFIYAVWLVSFASLAGHAVLFFIQVLMHRRFISEGKALVTSQLS